MSSSSASASTNPPPHEDRAAEILRSFAESDRRWQGIVRRRLGLVLMIALPLLLAFVWVLLVGYERHTLELVVGDGILRIESHQGPFEIVTTDEDYAKAARGGFGMVIHDLVESPRVVARSYDWASIAITEQRVKLPAAGASFSFEVNDLTFVMQGQELLQGNRRWLIRPGSIVRIDIDHLARPTSPGP